MERCATCRFFRVTVRLGYPDGRVVLRGRCLRYPPGPAGHPAVSGQDVCGEWRPADGVVLRLSVNGRSHHLALGGRDV